MTDIRLPASGNVQVRWHTANAFAVPGRPTPAEVNAGLQLENAISWNDYDFGIKASNTNSDPALSARSNTSDRGAAQYSGSMSFYLPLDPTDASSEYKLAHDALRIPRTLGWLTIQVDGIASDTSTPSYTGGITQTAAAGDLIHVFKVMTGGYSGAVTGETAFRETISFLPQGEVYINAQVATAAPAVVVTPATATVAVAAKAQLAATVAGRPWTHGVRWTTSDATKVTVSQGGVITRIAAGSATITATYQGGSATSVIS